jgi:3-oxoacyl-[acyl-carrier-protein] synthase II
LVITREVLLGDGRLGMGGLMAANGRRRVVITGLGAVTPLASSVATSWERLIGGRSAAGAISAFDASGFPVSFACEAKEFDPTRWIEYKQARRMDRFAQLVVAAARQAEFDSGIVIKKESDGVGASVATAMGVWGAQIRFRLQIRG